MKDAKVMKRMLAMMLTMIFLLTGCSSGREQARIDGDRDIYTEEQALEELKVKVDKIKPTKVDASPFIYDESVKTKAIADIDSFKMPVRGTGQIDIEIAAATELSSEAPDDLVIVWAENFNRKRLEVNGKSVSVSVRQMASGQIVTQMVEGDYRPDVCMPSFDGWIGMLDAQGITPVMLAERVAGNTAGILMSPEAYEKYTEKYGAEVTVGKVLQASIDGVISLAVTNPYTSSTMLNEMGKILDEFDPVNPLSKTAEEKLLEFQKSNVAMAYTTGVMSDWAKEGVVDTMLMEEQAYRKNPELLNYVYTPAGRRHDHPVCTFEYVSPERQEVAKLFAEYCLTNEAQAIATKKGFNLHDDYVGQDYNIDGAGFWSVQKIWKKTKDGGRPVIVVFVADISGSMDNDNKLIDLKKSLAATAEYIRTDYYVGLVSYSHKVYTNLEPEIFDKKQQALFYGAVNNLSASGETATYDAVLVALDLIEQKLKEVPDAKPMIFVLSDGETTCGYSLNNIRNIVEGLGVPIYSIGYQLDEGKEPLRKLSEIIEGGTLIDAKPEDIIIKLREMFSVLT